MRLFFPLLDARSSYSPVCMTAAYSSSSSVSPAERRSGELNARPGTRGGGGRAALGERGTGRIRSRDVIEVIRPVCDRGIRFLFCFSKDSSMSTGMVGACRKMERNVPARGVARQTT